VWSGEWRAGRLYRRWHGGGGPARPSTSRASTSELPPPERLGGFLFSAVATSGATDASRDEASLAVSIVQGRVTHRRATRNRWITARPVMRNQEQIWCFPLGTAWSLSRVRWLPELGSARSGEWAARRGDGARRRPAQYWSHARHAEHTYVKGCWLAIAFKWESCH
jgi:hypothetical protein